MRPLRHPRFAALFVLILFAPSIRPLASGLPGLFPLQTGIDQQRPRRIEPEAARWIAQLKSPNEEERFDAAIELAHLEDEAASSALALALTDPAPRVRGAAAAGLADRSETYITQLASCIAKDKSSFVRATAAHALAAFTGPERTAALVAALKDKNLEVRGAASVALADHADALAVSPLIAALSDNTAFVRLHSARAIGVNGRAAREAVPTLTRLLSGDRDNEVRRQAATALGRIGDRSGLAALELTKTDPDPYLAQASVEATRMILEKSKP